ncbi:hypothetical protein [Acinetobacter zhairhuonensis]|uniref:hypothetical protein n=1 Tax=Acinetobacter sp. A7.4 TaxID=2919921 RepID=UPI001F4F9B4A|nr:hypothetical protein [Acinetobacter sp. A7.4]MCJ8163166.1 hypothetical protein [Acinetobacter sp. A7.4]
MSSASGLAGKCLMNIRERRNRDKTREILMKAHILAGFTEKRSALNIKAKILIYEAKMFEN